LGRLDFEDYIESTRKFCKNCYEQVRGELDELQILPDTDVHIQWETGASMVQDYLKTCSFDMSYCYKARVVPVIFSVSQSEGMINGGQELVISGYGFRNGTVEVMIDGVECVEKTKTDHEVTCLTGRAD